MRKKTVLIVDQIEPRKKVKIAVNSVINVTSVAGSFGIEVVPRN